MTCLVVIPARWSSVRLPGKPLADIAGKPMVVRVPKGRREPEVMSSHGGEEFIFVLRGSLQFFMEPYSATILNEGDSVHFDSLMPHGFVALNDEDAWLLSVCLFDKKIEQRDREELSGEPEADGAKSKGD